MKLSRLPALLVFFQAGVSFAAYNPVLIGHVPNITRQLAPIGDLSRSNTLNLAIGLPLRNQLVLSNLIVHLYDPSSSNYHKYLTPQQFADKFGPTDEDYRILIQFANANGLVVTHKHLNHALLDVNASVADVERAFHLNLKVFRHPTEARTFYAPDTEPSMDLPISVKFVGGLDNFVLPQPASLKFSATSTAAGPQPNAGSAPDGSFLGADFRNAYAPGVPLTGAGQSVALLEFDGFHQNDITAYETAAGLPQVPLQTVLLNSFDGTPVTTLGNLEVSLDIEMVASVAPGISKIILYETGPNGLAEDLLSQIANDNTARQIASSWTWQSYNPNSEAIFLQFAAQGQTYFNATGDTDAFVGPITRSPVDDPYVTEVGGTLLTMTGSGAAYSTEAVWNRGNGVGSSGGISATYPIPAWQQGINMAANKGSTTNRNVPDVAMVAENVYVKYGNGITGAAGGTSCAAPLWAAFTALMNQQARAAGRPAVGFLNPAIYQIGTGINYLDCFHDVTVGDNTSSSSPSLFPAVAGFDLCTGWGSPTGSNFINAVVGPPVFVPLIEVSACQLLKETCPNGYFDPGETVTVNLSLQNVGAAGTSNLVATLQTSGGVLAPSAPAVYGPLVGGGAAVTRPFTFTSSGSCGGTNTATFLLQDGAANLGAVTVSLVLGQSSGSAFLAENFDELVPPALPNGWTVSWTGAGAAWSTTNSGADSPPNAAFVPDPPAISDSSLISPPFVLNTVSPRLTFRHSYYTESHYDGGALEISTNNGPFIDILTAGGSFVTNGYNQSIANGYGNPLAGRPAWSGNSYGYITTVVALPPAATGKTVRLRWRLGSDSIGGMTGWYLDAISLVGGYACCTDNHPWIQSITGSGGLISVVWLSTPGRTYRVQSKTNLLDSDWTDLPGDVSATDSVTSKMDSSGNDPRKFYRIILLP
jgi:hypothetical protein